MILESSPLDMNPTTTSPTGSARHGQDHLAALSRRRFLQAAGAGAAMLATGVRAAAEALTATVRNPLLRTPLALLIDDSCPVVNLGWHWIKSRHDWRTRLHPGTEPSGWERFHDKLSTMESTVPADFVREWGEWCGEQGIRGKFSMVPFPAGVGRIDQSFPGHSERELREWLSVTREIIQPNFDITPGASADEAGVNITTKFPAANFTLTLSRAAKRLRLGGNELREVKSIRDFRSGTFMAEGGRTHVAFDLADGNTAMHAAFT